MAEDARRLHDGVVVEERLAHSHEDDAAHGTIGLFADGEHLAHDLVDGQVAVESEGARGAEGASERAARLAGDADDVLLLLAFVGARVRAFGFARHRDADRLDAGAVVQFEEVFHEPVASRFPERDMQRLDAGLARDPGQHGPSESADVVEIQPMPLHGGGEELAARGLVEAQRRVFPWEHSAAVHQNTICIGPSSSGSGSRAGGGGGGSARFGGSRLRTGTAGASGVFGSTSSFPSTSCEASASRSTTYGLGTKPGLTNSNRTRVPLG